MEINISCGKNKKPVKGTTWERKSLCNKFNGGSRGIVTSHVEKKCGDLAAKKLNGEDSRWFFGGFEKIFKSAVAWRKSKTKLNYQTSGVKSKELGKGKQFDSWQFEQKIVWDRSAKIIKKQVPKSDHFLLRRD